MSSAKRIISFLVLGAVLALVGSDSAFTQVPGAKGGKAKGRRPEMMFDRLSGGADAFDVSTVAVPEQSLRQGETVDQRREAWLTFLETKGVTDGKMTRELFREFATAQAARPGGGAKAGKANPDAPPRAKGGGADAFFERFSGGAESFDIETVAIPKQMLRPGETVEKKRDTWRAFLEKNGVRNGVMTRALFREFFTQRSGSRPATMILPAAPPREEERRPVVYRAGKLPKGLPSWFEKLDLDGDGQVALYEWKKAGRPVKEFLAMDQNGDGFLTVEEVLRFEKSNKKKTPGDSKAGK